MSAAERRNGNSRILFIKRGSALMGAIAVLSAYFLQTATLAPNHTDEGIILEYIRDMASGKRPFFDFVDAYGILNWIFPTLSYEAAGERVWGIRIWMILLKIIAVLSTYVMVRALAASPQTDLQPNDQKSSPSGGRFYAILACAGLTVLLGASWQSMQTPYAFLTVIPLVVGAWHFIVSPPLANPVANVIVAALLTAMAIWTKLNTGMYLFAGGLFVYFLWLPRSLGPWTSKATTAERVWVPRAGIAAAVAFAILFTRHTKAHANGGFVLYLTLPLFTCLGLAANFASKDGARRERPREYTAPFAVFFLAVTVFSCIVLLGYYGRSAVAYIRELAQILSTIRYTAPFPKPGKPLIYAGLNEYFWLQIPLLTTVLFVVWALLGGKLGPRAFGEEWPMRRARISALFTLQTLHGYVIYARADETHLFQFLVLSLPVAVVIVAQLEAFLRVRSPARHSLRAQHVLRFSIAVLSPFYFRSLLVTPSRDTFDFRRSDWYSPKLEHLRYRRPHDPYLRNFSEEIPDHEWDIIEDEAGRYVKSITVPGEEVLLLTSNRLIYFDSETRPSEGRYHFIFYLACTGLLDRAGVERLVPKEVMSHILNSPPRVLVAGFDFVPLAEMFPELRRMRDTKYVHTRSWRHIWVYERKW